jgi:ATP-binding cassette subfamily B protein
LLIFTKLISNFIKQKNAINLKTVGNMSAEIQESLDNFKVIAVFNRRDYFNAKFAAVNQDNFQSSLKAGYANNILIPVYGLASNLAQILVLFYGIYLISMGEFTIGLLISYMTYVSNFYDPIRQIANMWSTFQMALAGWDRISIILALKSNLPILIDKTIPATTKIETKKSAAVLTFDHVSFSYPNSSNVLHNINLQLEKGKTYALVGPTGGGKTTTASLMARLYDPSKGKVLLDGRDIRFYDSAERTKKIGFILQEPFLFSGTIKENILYGNQQYMNYSDQQLEKLLNSYHLEKLLKRFDHQLNTLITGNDEAISLGQRQLIAFMRIVLRNPELLILDEATANVDTVTEQLLEEIMQTLPKSTTKVIIAHRLNTIENADQIFFVNSGTITLAGSLQHAIDMLLKQKRTS